MIRLAEVIGTFLAELETKYGARLLPVLGLLFRGGQILSAFALSVLAGLVMTVLVYLCAPLAAASMATIRVAQKTSFGDRPNRLHSARTKPALLLAISFS